MEAETTPAAATNGVAQNGVEGAMSATAAPEVMAEVAASANRWEAANNADERANEEEAAAEAAAAADAGNIVYMDEVRSERRIWDNSHK